LLVPSTLTVFLLLQFVKPKSQMQEIDSSRKWDDESGMDSSGESPLFGAAEIDSPYIDSARIGGMSGANSPRSG